MEESSEMKLKESPQIIDNASFMFGNLLKNSDYRMELLNSIQKEATKFQGLEISFDGHYWFLFKETKKQLVFFSRVYEETNGYCIDALWRDKNYTTTKYLSDEVVDWALSKGTFISDYEVTEDGMDFLVRQMIKHKDKNIGFFYNNKKTFWDKRTNVFSWIHDNSKFTRNIDSILFRYFIENNRL